MYNQAQFVIRFLINLRQKGFYYTIKAGIHVHIPSMCFCATWHMWVSTKIYCIYRKLAVFTSNKHIKHCNGNITVFNFARNL